MGNPVGSQHLDARLMPLQNYGHIHFFACSISKRSSVSSLNC